MTVTIDKDHIYRVDGKRSPGYSEILDSIGFPKNPFWTEEGRADGTEIHRWLLLLAQGFEPIDELDDRISGRVEGIRKFLVQNKFSFVGGETPMFNRELGYCCTPDLWGTLNGFSSVIEAKRGAKMARHRLQTAAQSLAFQEHGFIPIQRVAIYLLDGDYRLEIHDDEEDFEAWRAIVAGYYAKEIYGE